MGRHIFKFMFSVVVEVNWVMFYCSSVYIISKFYELTVTTRLMVLWLIVKRMIVKHINDDILYILSIFED